MPVESLQYGIEAGRVRIGRDSKRCRFYLEGTVVFWESVVDSLRVFLHWETYVGGVEYFVISFVPLIIIGGLIQGRSDRRQIGDRIPLRSLIVLPTLLKIIASAVFVLTLSPIILGLSDDAAWSLPWRIVVLAPGSFAKLIAGVLAVCLIIAWIPLLRRVDSLYVLVIGAVVLVNVLGALKQVHPDIMGAHVEIVPSFWFVVGILFIGGVALRLGVMLAVVSSIPIAAVNEDYAELFVIAAGGVSGFVPVFIYGSWLGSKIIQHAKFVFAFLVYPQSPRFVV
jgi:hypothetical protein